MKKNIHVNVKKEFYVNDHHVINHPIVNRMSVQNSPLHHSSETTSEVAFFWGLKFQTIVLEEFAEYTHTQSGDTRVYDFVPNELIESFLKTYRA